MALLDQNGRLFGRMNIIDFIMGAAIVLGVLGVFLVQSGTHVTSGQVVEGESDIIVTVQIPKLSTIDQNLFKKGELTAITIRNQLRGEVRIQDVTVTPTKMTAIDNSGKASVVDDLAMQNSYDYIIRLKDHAKITKDGYVTEGVKAKVGLPIELEGFKYRVYGKIVDVEAVK